MIALISAFVSLVPSTGSAGSSDRCDGTPSLRRTPSPAAAGWAEVLTPSTETIGPSAVDGSDAVVGDVDALSSSPPQQAGNSKLAAIDSTPILRQWLTPLVIASPFLVVDVNLTKAASV